MIRLPSVTALGGRKPILRIQSDAIVSVDVGKKADQQTEVVFEGRGRSGTFL